MPLEMSRRWPLQYGLGKKKINLPYVTVIMPNYNGARFIAESIQSVLGQTFTDFELMLVDDGSTDTSVSIANEYAKSDRRIKIIMNEKNRGQSYTLNRGISAATGEFICFIDSDDIFRPTRLEKLVGSLENAKSSVGYTDVFLIDPDGRTTSGSFLGTKRLPPTGYAYPYFLTQWCWGLGIFMSHISTIREIGCFDESLDWGNDFDYVLRLTGNHKIVLIPEALYGYRLHSQSMTSLTSSKLKGQAYIRILEANLVRNWKNLDELTKFEVIQRIRHIAKNSGMRTKYLKWSVNLSFLRLALPHLTNRITR